MAAAFPSATKSFTTKADGAGNTISASHVNDVQDEIVAVEDWLRTTLGTWTAPAFSAGNFTASESMIWTVAEADVTTYAYRVIGKSMLVAFHIATTTVAGTPDKELRIAVPASATIAKTMSAPITVIDDGTQQGGYCLATAGVQYIKCFVDVTGATNWKAATNTSGVFGQIEFEIA